MKKIVLLVAGFYGLCVQNAQAQVTYLADTAFTTDAGYGGAPASCRAEHCRYFGWNMNRATSQFSADVFTVPAGATWTFDTVIVYGMQRNSGTTSTFLNCNLQVYNGTPGLGGSVIWGDTSTNVLAATDFTGIYKVDTIASNGGLLSNANPIMYLKLYLSPAPALSAGTYWLMWSAACSGTNNPVCPDKVLPGRINPSGQSGRGLYSGSWQYDTDSSHTAGFNKIIKARAGLEAVITVNNQPSVSLSQNVPNPAAERTELSFYLHDDGYANLSIYNTLGQLVKTLADGNMAPGPHNVNADVSCLPEGIYYYTLKTTTGTQSKKMQVLR